MTSECRASIQYLVCSNVLVYAHACVSACVRYRSGENNYVHGYIYKFFCFVFVLFCFFATEDKCMAYIQIKILNFWKSLVVLVLYLSLCCVICCFGVRSV